MKTYGQHGNPETHLMLAPADKLTMREQEILALLVKGLTNHEISSQLHLAPRTVKWYNSQIYSKLGASNRQEAVARAQQSYSFNSPSESQPKHNLPYQATLLIGRHQETIDLIAILTKSENRLVTILAPGGMGKTRLALAVARKLLPQFHDGVFFVPLASVNSANAIVTTIAECIGYTFYGENPPLQQLIHYLKDRVVLLVMDNFEHLLNGASFVSEIIKDAPGVRILATSRERLNLHGEVVYILNGLSFPTQETGNEGKDYDAVTLFIENARRVRMNFPIQPEDRNIIARICCLTAGMPLGIELAAGWVDVLSLAQIESELQQGIDILETDLRDVPERQRSVRATFEQTWLRMDEIEQKIFTRLSVFRGGFTLSASQAVAGATAYQLRKLAQKALIQLEGHNRFTVHELLRQFGAGKLSERGEMLAIQARHAAFFTEFMLERKQDIKTNRQLEALEMIDHDIENLRTAWSYLVSHQQWEQIPAFLFSLWFYWDVRTRGQEAIGLFELAVNALRRLPSSAPVNLALGRVLAPLGWFYKETGFAEKAAVTCIEAVRILRQTGTPEDLLTALYYRQHMAGYLFQPGVVVSIAEEGLRIAQSIGDPFWEGYFLLWAGAGMQDGVEIRFGRTRQFAEQAHAIFTALNNRWGIMHASEVLGSSYKVESQFEPAKHYLLQALSIAEMFKNARTISVYHSLLAQVALAERDHAAAWEHFLQSLEVYWNAGYTWLAPYPLYLLAKLYIDQQDFDRAVMVLATISPMRLEFAHTDRSIHLLREELARRLDPDRFDAAWALGQKRTLNALVTDLLAELHSCKF